jgi:hypothetical protein
MELKLGKLPPIIDERTIPLSKILRMELLPELPTSYDLDEVLGVNDNFMFNNSVYGDCVIAARAHQTLRFEAFEQGLQVPIADKEVIDEYFKESGGRDTGLVMLTSLKAWRNNGWKVGNKNYTIYAFASVDWHDHDQVKHCIHLLGGVNFGMMVFSADIDQFKNGEGWHLIGQNGTFEGGHGVYACKYRDTERIKIANLLAEQAKLNGGKTWLPRPDIVGYDENGVWCMTWGVKQFMTWDFWDQRVDEAYGIVDNRDSWLGNSPVDINKLDGYLKEITGDGDNGGCVIPVLGNIVPILGKLIRKA